MRSEILSILSDGFRQIWPVLLVEIAVVAIKWAFPDLDPNSLVLIATVVVSIMLYLLSRRDGGLDALVAVVIASAILLLLVSFVIRDPDLKRNPSKPDKAVIVEQSQVSVPANCYWLNTDVKVEKGDYLELKAKGKWYSGISTTGPKGDRGIKALLGLRGCGQCPVVFGNLGELVGRVGNDFPFRIGNSAVVVATKDADLWLAMNDSTGSCGSGPPGSCYDDNHGWLQVTVTVWRIP
jgi:hypothetical protein